MVTVLQQIARALLPPAIRRPLADRFYAAVTVWRNLEARGKAAMARPQPPPAAPVPAGPVASAPVAQADASTLPGDIHVGTRSWSERLRHRAAWPLTRVRATAASLGAAMSRAAQRLVAAAMPLVWARPPHTVRTRVARPVVLAGLRVLDDVFERRFRALVQHALPVRPARTGRPTICLMIGTLGPGGAERQATNTLLGLREHFDVDLHVVPSFQDVEWQRFFAPSLRAAGIPVDAVVRGGDPLALLAGCGHPDAPALAQAIGATLPASLHDVAVYARELLLRTPDIAHLWLDEVNVRAGLAAVLTGVPRIVLGTRSINPSNFPLFQPYMRAGYRVILDRAEVALLNNSDTGAASYQQWIGRPGLPCTVLRNGFDFDRLLPPDPGAARAAARARFGLPADALVLGGIMRFSEEKRPVLWLDAAELVRQRCPDVRLLLIGDGVLRDEVHARAAAGGLAGRVLLPGHDDRAYEAICAMDVLFLSSRHEGLPNVLIEAQALGVPVVTMRAGGAPETLVDGETGWVVPGPSASDAAAVLSAALGDPARLRQAGARGRQHARDRFGLERMLEETARMYGLVTTRSLHAPLGHDPAGGASGDS